LGLGDVRITVAGIIERVDREPPRQLRHDLLEEIELGAQGVEEHEVRPPTGLDVTKLAAADLRHPLIKPQGRLEERHAA
jgi:hypothetical protein